jgi:hypothetical protein
MSKTTPNKRGGQRPGAGRKKGPSAYGESTKAMRIPESPVLRIHALLNARRGQLQTIANLADVIYLSASAPDKRFLPLFAGKVAAGLNERPNPISSSYRCAKSFPIKIQSQSPDCCHANRPVLGSRSLLLSHCH